LKLGLPLFLTPKLKYPAGAVMFGIAYFLYYFTNHHPAFTPRTLPMIGLDEVVPFVPWTVLIYVSEYVYFTVIYIICRDMENVNKYLYSFFSVQLLSCIVFYFWPTVYPRELFPLPADLHPFLRGVWDWLRNQDAPTNCFPSLHVSTVYLSAFIFRDEQREKFPFFLIWGTLIAFSTLPTKQHYFVDVVAGWLLSFAAYYFFHRVIQYRPMRWVVRGAEARNGVL